VWKYEEIGAWQKGHQLTKEVFAVTDQFPAEIRFGLSAQLRRAAMAVPTNIAEGAGRASRKDFAHFLVIASGSANETEYLLLLAFELGYLDDPTHANLRRLTRDVRKLLISYRGSLVRQS
jgi:four helix bundle protein